MMYVLSSQTVSAPTQVLFLCLFPSMLRNSGNKHKNNSLVNAETFLHSSIYIILYTLGSGESLALVRCQAITWTGDE